MTGGLKGVENIYTQHTPLLQQTLDQLAKGKLKEPAFPFVDKQYRDKPQDIIVFMVGGTTYVAVKAVYLLLTFVLGLLSRPQRVWMAVPLRALF